MGATVLDLVSTSTSHLIRFASPLLAALLLVAACSDKDATGIEWNQDKVGRVMEPRRLTVKDGFTYENCVVAAAKNACLRTTQDRSACSKKHQHPESPDSKRKEAATAGFSITDASPNHGPPSGGPLITVVGTGLDRKLTVIFGDAAIDIIQQRPTKRTFKSPAARPGAYQVVSLVFENGHKQHLMPFGYLGVSNP